MKKRLMSLVLIMMMAIGMFVMAGCSKEEPVAEGGDLLDQIKAKGYINVGMEGTWAPWTFHDETDALVGFDVEVAKYIADYIGVEVKYTEADWDALLAALDVNRIDVMVNGVTWTEERAQKYDFTDAYVYDRTVLIVREDNSDIHTFEDLNGKTTNNSIDSVYMNMAEGFGANVLGVDSLDDTLQNVIDGRADATLNSEQSFYDFMSVHPDAPLKVVAKSDDLDSVCIPMPKAGSESLLAAMNEAIAAAHADGTLSELSIKYFGADMTKAD